MIGLDEMPQGFVRAVVAAYGLLFGSFLNVVIHRVPRGLSVVRPRSACPGCGHLIPWWENVPILSWLVLRGRCSSCRLPIAWRYPAVELLTALLLLACLAHFGLGIPFLAACVFVLLSLALVFIDLEHMLLPDALTLPGTFVALALSFAGGLVAPADALLGALLGVAIIESLNLAYKLVRGHDGMGAGDTKMMMMMGAFLGWRDVIVSLVLASFVGVAIAIPALLIARARRARAHDDASPQSGDESRTESAALEEAEPEDARPRRILVEILPRAPGEWLALLTFLALVAAFVVPSGDPERALAGCLVGVAVLAIAKRFATGGRLAGAAQHVAPYLPLVGAVAGLPPRAVPGAIALAVAGAFAWLTRGHVEAAGDSVIESEADEPLDAGPALMQAAIPFGVFLGIAGIITLLAGDSVVDWYLGLAERMLGPAE